MAEVGLVVLGWFLGLVSTPIVEWISRSYRRRQLRRTLWAELDEFRYKLIMICSQIRFTQARLDSQFLAWAKKHIEAYSGVQAESLGRERMMEFATLPQEQLDQFNAAPRHPREGIVFMRYGLPFLESQLGDLRIFPLQTQRRLLEIVMRLDAFNQTVDQIAANTQRTFDSDLSATNREAVDINTSKWCIDLESTAKLMVQHIDGLESSFAT